MPDLRLCTGALVLALAGCGSGGSHGPTRGYMLSATAFGTTTAGTPAAATLTLTPQNGYTGTVSLSCTVSGGGSPAPTCAPSAASVPVGPGVGTATLTVSSVTSTPGGTYRLGVSARDASGLTPSNGPPSLALTVAAVIQHIVVIFQENRTPDNLFQDPVLIARGADIVSSGLNSKGQTIPLAPINLGNTGSNPQNYDLSHAHAAFVSMYDGGKMDGADLIP